MYVYIYIHICMYVCTSRKRGVFPIVFPTINERKATKNPESVGIIILAEWVSSVLDQLFLPIIVYIRISVTGTDSSSRISLPAPL